MAEGFLAGIGIGGDRFKSVEDAVAPGEKGAFAAGNFPAFMEKFFDLSEQAGEEQHLVTYSISSLPGCTEKEMDTVD